MFRISRREMLERSMQVAAAVPVLAVAPTPARELRRPVGPGERVRLALIGVGGRGLQQLAAFLEMRDLVEVAALCDVDEVHMARGAKLVEDGSGETPRCEKDLRKLLEAKSI